MPAMGSAIPYVTLAALCEGTASSAMVSQDSDGNMNSVIDDSEISSSLAPCARHSASNPTKGPNNSQNISRGEASKVKICAMHFMTSRK